MCTQSDDFKFFKENHDMLYSEYPNKNIVIQDKEVLFAADTFKEALSEALNKGLKLGTFIIQECTEGDKGYVQSFSSRVVFS